jgi:hypothetical protein
MWGEMDRDKENQEALDKHTGMDRPRQQREEIAKYYQTFKPDETWVEKEERKKREKESRRNDSSGPRNTRGSVMPGAALLFAIFAILVLGVQSALNGAIDQHFAGHLLVGHFLQSWLALTVRVFLPASFVIMFICAVTSCFWQGVKFVIAAGMLSFIGTFLYLIISGIFLGK